VDLAQIINCPPREPERVRLSPGDVARIRNALADAGLRLRAGADLEGKLTDLRRLYEPYVHSLARHLRILVPPWIPESSRFDNWQTSTWGRATGFEIEAPSEGNPDEHF